MDTNKFTKLSIKREISNDIEFLRVKLGLRSAAAVVAFLVKEKKAAVAKRG